MLVCIVAETTDAALPYVQSRSAKLVIALHKKAPGTVCGPGLSPRLSRVIVRVQPAAAYYAIQCVYPVRIGKIMP